MNIAEIVPSLAEERGGPSRSVRGLSAALAENASDRVTLLSTEGTGGDTSASSLRVKISPLGWPGRIGVSRDLWHRLVAEPWDILHHHGLWLRSLHYAHRAALCDRVPLVISPRGMASPWAWRHHRWKKFLAEHLVHPGAFQGASGWHATSLEEAEDIRRLGFTQPVCVSPNGVEIKSAEFLQTAKSWWQQFCPSLSGSRVALFYSRFHSKKRVVELLEIWGRIAPRGWKLLVVGIPEEFSAESLREKIPVTVRDSVIVESGLGKPPPYSAASLFVLPTHHENFGMAIAEALAAGVPALVTDTTPWKKLNENSGGWCVPWADFPAALRGALALDETELSARGHRAREWLAETHSWGKSARELREFYASLRLTR